MNYLESLELLKTSFMGGTEVEEISSTINKHFTQETLIYWLDIGIGDGKSTKKIISGLRPSIQTSVVGLDPLLNSTSAPAGIFRSENMMTTTFENFKTEKTFDIVHARQSVYYMKNKKEMLEKMLSLVSKDGLLIITNWSKDSILCKLHNMLFSKLDLNITSEEIVEFFENKGLCCDVTQCNSYVDFSKWNTKVMLLAAIQIISRHEMNLKEMNNAILLLKTVLLGLNVKEKRIDTVISVKL